VLQFLAIGQDALAGHFGGHLEAIQRLQMRPHVLEGLYRPWRNGVRRRRGYGAGWRRLLRQGHADRREQHRDEMYKPEDRATPGALPIGA
jgi:hypothetical protein